MPSQVFTSTEFLQLAEKARECRVVRRGDTVKLKLRSSRYLYTYVTKEEEANQLLRQLKIPVVEL